MMEDALAHVGRMVLWPFDTDRVDRWRWDLTRVCRGAFVSFVVTVLAALVWLPLVWPALLFFVVSVLSFAAAGVCLLEVERREALVSR